MSKIHYQHFIHFTLQYTTTKTALLNILYHSYSVCFVIDSHHFPLALTVSYDLLPFFKPCASPCDEVWV